MFSSVEAKVVFRKGFKQGTLPSNKQKNDPIPPASRFTSFVQMNPVHMKPSLQDLENWTVAAEEVGTASRILPGSGRLSTALTNHGPIYLLNV